MGVYDLKSYQLLKMITTNHSNLQDENPCIFIDENCTYFSYLDSNQQQVYFYLFQWSYTFRHVQRTSTLMHRSAHKMSQSDSMSQPLQSEAASPDIIPNPTVEEEEQEEELKVEETEPEEKKTKLCSIF